MASLDLVSQQQAHRAPAHKQLVHHTDPLAGLSGSQIKVGHHNQAVLGQGDVDVAGLVHLGTAIQNTLGNRDAGRQIPIGCINIHCLCWA